MTSCPNAPPRPCTCSAPTCCSRCGSALVEFRARLAVDAPDVPPQTGALCLDCYELLDKWFLCRRPSVAPLARRVRVPSAVGSGSAARFGALFSED